MVLLSLGLRQRLEKTPLGQLEMSKTIVFVDWRLGLLNAVLILGSMAICIFLMITQSAYVEPVSTPTITYWFDNEDGMRDVSAAAATTLPEYCNNPEFNYYDCTDERCPYTCSGQLLEPFYSADPNCTEHPWWDDLNILCRTYSMAEIVRKTGDVGWVFTLLKEHVIEKQLCNASFSCPTRTDTQRQWWDVATTPQGTICTCETMQDFYVLGAEKLVMYMQHGFGTSTMMDTDSGVKKKTNWGGKSAIEKEDLKNGHKRIHTTVYKKCPPGVSFENEENTFADKCKEVKTFKPGENVVFSIEEWLDLADTKLDDHISLKKYDDVVTGENGPTRRTLGSNLEVKITYEGNTDNTMDFKAAITVSLKSHSFSSFGHFVTHTIKRSLGEDDVNQEFVDSFARGVRFNFVSAGFIKKFDWETALNFLVDTVLIIMGVLPALLKVVAFNWPGDLKAPVYEAATNEKFSYRGALATFSAQSAMAKEFASAFEVDASGRITRANFEEQLRKNFPPFSAAAITESIFAAVDAENDDDADVALLTDDFVTKEDLMNIFTSQVFDMQALLKASFRKLEEFPPSELMNLEELRAIAALEKVDVGTDDNLKVAPSRLTAQDAAKAKAEYRRVLSSALSKLNTIKHTPSHGGAGRNSLDSKPSSEWSNASEKKAEVKIRIPRGAMPGQVIAFTAPSGEKIQFTLPPDKRPGDLVTVAVSKPPESSI